jgi:DNA topoisomerase IA
MAKSIARFLGGLFDVTQHRVWLVPATAGHVRGMASPARASSWAAPTRKEWPERPMICSPNRPALRVSARRFWGLCNRATL